MRPGDLRMRAVIGAARSAQDTIAQRKFHHDNLLGPEAPQCGLKNQTPAHSLLLNSPEI